MYPFFEDCMQTFIMRTFIFLTVLGASFVQAAEFKPFLTLKIAGPETIINTTEKISSLADPTGASGVKAMLAAFKRLPGVNASGVIGLTLQSNELSPFGLDAVLVLPIADLDRFNIPGQEVQVGMLKSMMQKEGDRYMISSPVGDFVAYQKTGYIVVAPLSAADFASTADPKKLFAGLEKFTFGATVDWDNITVEEAETMLGMLAVALASQGKEFDPTDILANLSEGIDELSVSTMGLTIDERTLTINISVLLAPKNGTEKAAKFQNLKKAKTMFGGFLQDTAKTVFSWSYMDFLTDREVEAGAAGLQLIGDSFIEGFRETTEEEEGGEQFARATEIIVEWLQEIIDFYSQHKSVDAAVSLDSDGIFLYAEAMEKPELITKIGYDLYNALPELLGEEQGNAMQTLIGSKMKQDYETVAGFSLSSLSNPLLEVPPGIVIPRALKVLPVHLFWAVKPNEAVAVAIGLDPARTERALKTALEKTKTPIQPKQTAVFGVKAFGELWLKQFAPFVESFGAGREELDEAKVFLALLASADSNAKIVVTTEFPNDAQLQKVQIDGKCIATLFKFAQKGMELNAQRAVRELQRQQQSPGEEL